MKKRRTRKPASSTVPIPIRKAQVPVPPERPVVSVSRKAQRSGGEAGISPLDMDGRRFPGRSAMREISTVPWRRWWG
jgi:hypothetical protein